ncbi:MAG TPA: ABC transporter substrate-binding protein, partial [Chloroflexota bacterium]
IAAMFWRIAFAFAAAALLMSCSGPQRTSAPAGSSAAASGANRVRFGANNTSLDSTLYFLTKSAGIFSRNGVDAELHPAAGAASLDSLIAGETDGIAIGGPQTVLLAIQHGAPLRIVAVPSAAYNVLIVTPSSITSLAQLKGKRVGAQSETAINAQGMRRALHDAGLEAGRDYEFVVTGASGSANGVFAALVAHQIDAAPLDEFNARRAIDQGGFHSLLDLASPEAHIVAAFSVVTFRIPFIEQHPDLVQRTVDSLIEGARYLKEHQPETIAALKSRAGIDDPALLEATYQRQALLLAKAPVVTKDRFEDAVRYLPKGAQPIGDDQLATSLEPRFVDDAVRRGLTNY